MVERGRQEGVWQTLTRGASNRSISTFAMHADDRAPPLFGRQPLTVELGRALLHVARQDDAFDGADFSKAFTFQRHTTAAAATAV